MHIHVLTAVGEGPTKLAAFDNALIKAGIANYNLIPLSSIIPHGSTVITDPIKPKANHNKWGDRLYVVIANWRVEHNNDEAWAGLGWVQDPKTGKGVFVEHEGPSQKTVKRDIKDSLKGMSDNREGKYDFSNIKMEVVGGTCKGKPICALAIAVYEAESWNS